MDVYSELTEFYQSYMGEKRIIGRSAEGRNLYAFFAGSHGGVVGISQSAIHAREWITAYLALAQIGCGVSKGGVWFVPLVNPDGALLSAQGLNSVCAVRRERLLSLNGGSEDFSLWKANAQGIDLNVNFPARWGTGRKNVKEPAPENYIGASPLSAPESRALAEFTMFVQPQFTLSWHTKGEEIYWRFHQSRRNAARDLRYAKRLSRMTGYPLKEAFFSAGGYKDWCVEELGIPAFTLEVGSDSLTHPIGFSALGGLIAKCGNTVRDFTEGF